MLEDVILTKNVCGKTISILLYSIDKDMYFDEGRHNHYYEVRISYNDEYDTFETYAENYLKSQSLKLFNQVCKEIQEEYDDMENRKYLTNKFMSLLQRV